MPDFSAKYANEFDESGIEHEGNENMLQLIPLHLKMVEKNFVYLSLVLTTT